MPPALKLTVAKAELLYRGRDHFWRVIRRWRRRTPFHRRRGARRLR